MAAQTRLVLICCGLVGVLTAILHQSPAQKPTDDRALPIVTDVAAQPLWAQVQRVVEAMDYLGHPLSDATKTALEKAGKTQNDAALVRGVQAALDPYCLLAVQINPESRVKVSAGPAKPELVENGWRQFLV